MLKQIALILTLITFLALPTNTLGRTTPEDIVNAQKESYNNRIASYSQQNKQKLLDWDKKIEVFNDQKCAELEYILQTQGAILDEFIRRNEIAEKKVTDGKTRNLSDPIENARYWLTFAHEAVAYQAAKVYIFNPTTEPNVNRDILGTINSMQSDISVLRGKVQKSQDIIENLVTTNKL